KLSPDWRKEWVKNFDPSQYAGQAKMPVLFVNSTNDFAYPLDSYQRTYRLVKEDRTVCITVNMPHGHPQGWAPVEIGLFVDSHLRGGKPLPTLAVSDPETRNGKTIVFLSRESGRAVKKVQLHWTTDAQIPWQKRKWQTSEVQRESTDPDAYYAAEIPKQR